MKEVSPLQAFNSELNENLLDWAVPKAIDISWVIICPQDMVTRVQSWSSTGKSGNMTILTRRARGNGWWFTTEVGGAAIPEKYKQN